MTQVSPATPEPFLIAPPLVTRLPIQVQQVQGLIPDPGTGFGVIDRLHGHGSVSQKYETAKEELKRLQQEGFIKAPPVDRRRHPDYQVITL